jgi:hypothetical protein
MALLGKKKTPEELQLTAEAREAEREQKKQAKRAQEVEDARRSFEKTPAGQARAAYDRGDHVFQYSANVMSQQAIIVAMVGSNASQRTTDPSVILNSVCNEGWELVNGSFVFIETGQQSRDKFLASGQNVAVSGATVGYYLFRRSERLRQEPPPEPWKIPVSD